jgi:hypothetical protein
VPNYGAYRAAAARIACAAIARGCHGGGQTRDFNSTRKKRPAVCPPRWGSRAAAGLHSTPSTPSTAAARSPPSPLGVEGGNRAANQAPPAEKGQRAAGAV